MADLADNLIEIDLYQARYPAWIERPALPGYNTARMKKEILSFGRFLTKRKMFHDMVIVSM